MTDTTDKPATLAPTEAEVRKARNLKLAIEQTEGALRPVEQAYKEHPSQGVFWFDANIWHVRTILAALDKAQARECNQDTCCHVQNSADATTQCLEYQGQIAVLRAENARLMEESRTPLLGAVQQASYELRKFIDSAPSTTDARLIKNLETVLRALYEGALYRHDICKIATILGIQYHMTQRVTTFVDTVREWSNSYDRVLTRAQEAEEKIAAQAGRIAELEAMSDRELDERIAKALCLEVRTVHGLDYVVGPDGTWLGLGHTTGVQDFSPATSVDALRKWVLPEVERRGLADAFKLRMISSLDASGRDVTPSWFALTCPPSTLAAAALAVLEEDNA